MMRFIRNSALVAICLLGVANPAASQYATPSGVQASVARAPFAANSSFGERVGPHVRDGFKRALIGTAAGILGMALGVGIEELNSSSCGHTSICPSTNPVKTASSYAFVFGVVGAVAPEAHSRCNRGVRALLALGGAAVGITVAGAIADTRYLEALPGSKPTIGNLSAGALGIGLGAGAFAAIC